MKRRQLAPWQLRWGLRASLLLHAAWVVVVLFSTAPKPPPPPDPTPIVVYTPVPTTYGALVPWTYGEVLVNSYHHTPEQADVLYAVLAALMVGGGGR